MKGIILAGGTGSRLWPLTIPISKQLLPVYDKPMIYYPISTFMLAGIREIMIITRPEEVSLFEKLLGDGKDWGVNFQYEVQAKPAGIAEAFLIAEKFLDGQGASLILGDNLFYGSGLGESLGKISVENNATIFGYQVANPREYGVIELDSFGAPKGIEEKPKSPKSNFAIPGLYFYPGDVSSKARSLKLSARGELEISDLNKLYLLEGRLEVRLLNRGTLWMDTGTIDDLHNAAAFVKIVEERQQIKIACPEEIAFMNGWINLKNLLDNQNNKYSSSYRTYLELVLNRISEDERHP
jgi:glucose-1-phosphate thymidylyltransferase